MKHAYVGQRQAYRPIGTFTRLTGRHVYVYKHVDHASCSSVLLSQIHLCLTTHEQPEEVAKCSTPEHNRLLPFFYSNKSLLKFYKESFMKGLLELKSDIDLLEKIENEGESNRGTPFVAPVGPPTGWQGNDWTKWLIHGTRQLFQTAK